MFLSPFHFPFCISLMHFPFFLSDDPTHSYHDGWVSLTAGLAHWVWYLFVNSRNFPENVRSELLDQIPVSLPMTLEWISLLLNTRKRAATRILVIHIDEVRHKEGRDQEGGGEDICIQREEETETP